MKKYLLASLLLLVCTAHIYSYEVPTDVQKKNVLLEEFTGIHCGYCPQGHKIANALNTAQPGVAYVIAVHSGSFAKPYVGDPDFRTDEGEALDSDLGAGVMGYPCGTVSRHIFQGTSVILSRDAWIKNAKQIHSDDAPVNLWIKSEFDGTTRSLKVRVEGYYTSETQSSEQFLNIAWTQSNIQGIQSGSGVGDEYIHQHMLRGYVTPMWGDQLDNPQKGTYFQKEYTYQLPEDVRSVPVKVEDIEIIAFVTTGHKEVLNVVGEKPVYSNYEKPLGATLSAPKIAIAPCYGFNFFEAVLKNNSDKAITEANFEIAINNESQNVAWSGNISSFASMPITLKVSPYTINDKNNYKITLLSVNGQNVEASSLQGTFVAPLESTPTIGVAIQTDLYADENRFLIKNAEGEIIKEFGPYVTNKKAVYKETAELEAGKIYCLEVLDAWGDGIQQPKGYIKIYTDNEVLVEQDFDIPQYGSRSFFRTSLNPSGIIGNLSDNIYTLDLQGKQIRVSDVTSSCNITLYSMEGKCLLQSENTSISISSIPSGIYLLKIVQNEKVNSSKIIIY